MIWQDLLLDRWVDGDALCAATASAFGVPGDLVAVIDHPEQLLAISPSTRVIVERDRQHRDFPLQILVVLRDEALSERFVGTDGALRVARRLAEHLKASVLFAEGPLAPSEWIRVRPTGEVDVVSLDVDDEGDVDSFFLVAERTLRDGQSPDAPSRSRRSA